MKCGKSMKRSRIASVSVGGAEGMNRVVDLRPKAGAPRKFSYRRTVTGASVPGNDRNHGAVLCFIVSQLSLAA
jgi:hypothetical protein